MALARPAIEAEIVRRTGPAMMDFQNDKSNIASHQFMEMLNFRSMIIALRREEILNTPNQDFGDQQVASPSTPSPMNRCLPIGASVGHAAKGRDPWSRHAERSRER